MCKNGVCTNQGSELNYLVGSQLNHLEASLYSTNPILQTFLGCLIVFGTIFNIIYK